MGCMPALRLPHDGGQLKLSGTQGRACPLILYLPAVPPTHMGQFLQGGNFGHFVSYFFKK